MSENKNRLTVLLRVYVLEQEQADCVTESVCLRTRTG